MVALGADLLGKLAADLLTAAQQLERVGEVVARLPAELGAGALALELWAGATAVPAELSARLAGLGPTARLRGRGDAQDIAMALAGADVFVLSSRYESYGIAAAEALRAGAVVVSWWNYRSCNYTTVTTAPQGGSLTPRRRQGGLGFSLSPTRGACGPGAGGAR